MFNIALALVLSWDDDGQTVFLTKPVGGTADIVIASLVGMIVLMIRKADCIENQVVMNMIFVYILSLPLNFVRMFLLQMEPLLMRKA